MVDIFGEDFDYEGENEHGDDHSTFNHKTLSLEDAFEPSELIDKLFTDEDEAIRVIDVPERIQLRDGQYRPPLSDSELRLESVWIAFKIEKLTERPEHDDFRKSFLNAIAAVVKFVREDLFEIPFIASHRKEYFINILTLDDLWAIYDFDGRWKIIQQRRDRVLSIIDQLPQSDKDIEIQLVQLLNKPELDEIDVEDCLEYIQTKYSRHPTAISIQEDVSTKTSAYKRPIRASYLQSKSDQSILLLKGFIDNFGISTRQFSINLLLQTRQFEPEDFSITPEKLAESFVSLTLPTLSTVETTLDTVINMLAKEFSLEPLLRKAFRTFAKESMFFTIWPTEKGMYEITNMHEYAHIKYLNRKPSGQFVEDEYLEILEATSSSLLNIEIEVIFSDRMRSHIDSFITSEMYSAYASAWNPFRRRVIDVCINSYLAPYLRKIECERLRNEAMEWVGLFCQRSLTGKLLCGPYIHPNQENSKQIGDKKYVAVSWGDGIQGSISFAVCVDSEGTLLDHLKMTLLTDRSKRNEDLTSLSSFLSKIKPYVVGVCGTSISSKLLMTEMKTVVENNPHLNSVECIWIDDDVARIFSGSIFAAEEFKGFPALFSYTVSLARRLVDPLCEYARLAKGKDILGLRLHNFLPLLTDAWKNLERAFVNVVNLIGVDINRAIKYPFVRPLLQFVCGLGARKSQSLLRTITKGTGYIEHRIDLLRKGICGKRVFLNAASFLKIDTKYLPKRHQYEVDVLDLTRIHPESYELARKMAADALEIAETLDDDQNPSFHVEELMNQPSKLDELLLDEYAKELERIQRVPKHVTLSDIRTELKNPFRDGRIYVPVDLERLFEILTDENDRTLFPGQIVSFEVSKIGDRGCFGKIVGSGISGSLAVRNISDDYISNPVQEMEGKDVVLCKIISVNKERCSVELSSKPSDMMRMNTSKVLDRYYDYDREMREHSARPEQSDLDGDDLDRRWRMHPLFRNIGRAGAESILVGMSDGDVVVRPSSKGKDFLGISWRMAGGFKHTDMKIERNGLVLDGELFEDVDEIIARYIDPIVGYCAEFVSHPKFYAGENTDAHLRILKSEQPKRIVYALSISKPGFFALAYLPYETVYREPIEISCMGFSFRKQMYKSIADLLNTFKRDHIVRQSERQNHK